MKKSILLLLFFLFVVMGYAQENETITNRLKQKYGVAVYHTTNGGWYSISTGGYDGKACKGACDLKGNEIIPPQYDKIMYRGDYYEVELDGKMAIRDLNNRELFPFKYETVRWSQLKDYDYAEVKLNGKTGVIDKQGSEIVTPKYDEVSIHQFKDNEYAGVKLNGRVGVVDRQGNEVVAPQYDDINTFQFRDREYAEVKLNEKTGVVDKQGNEIIAPQYDAILTWEFKDWNYARVDLNGKWGLVDTQGNEILSCDYTCLNFAKSGEHMFVQIAKGGVFTERFYPPVDGKWGLFDLDKQKWIVSCKYDYLSFPFEGLIAFNMGGKITDYKKWWDSIHGGKWGYIAESTGEEIIAAQYETAGAFKDGAAQVSLNGQTTLIKNPLVQENVNISGHLASTEVDVNIPVTNIQNEETFAFIFANENYMNFSVPSANNDGRVFKEYCSKTLGVPEQNIRFYEDATFGNMVSAVNKIKEIADAYDGDAGFIIYYSGQGMTDENSKVPYLLPVDAVLTNLTATGYSMEKLNNELSHISAKSTLLILDACFSGTNREGNMLTSARGVAIKTNPSRADGSLILLSASTGDETAYHYKEKNHGLFTYYLLKKLQETQGDISYKALSDYITTEVKKQSVLNSRIQSPHVIVSDKLKNWQTLKFR